MTREPAAKDDVGTFRRGIEHVLHFRQEVLEIAIHRHDPAPEVAAWPSRRARPTPFGGERWTGTIRGSSAASRSITAAVSSQELSLTSRIS
jgi:hypothetical protein